MRNFFDEKMKKDMSTFKRDTCFSNVKIVKKYNFHLQQPISSANQLLAVGILVYLNRLLQMINRGIYRRQILLPIDDKLYHI